MGQVALTRWDGSTMLGCRSQVIRQFWDGSIALMFRLTHQRFIVGYALGDDGMFFRGELLTDCDESVPVTKPSNLLSTGHRSTKKTKPIPGTACLMRVTAPTGDGSQVGRSSNRPT